MSLDVAKSRLNKTINQFIDKETQDEIRKMKINSILDIVDKNAFRKRKAFFYHIPNYDLTIRKHNSKYVILDKFGKALLTSTENRKKVEDMLYDNLEKYYR